MTFLIFILSSLKYWECQECHYAMVGIIYHSIIGGLSLLSFRVSMSFTLLWYLEGGIPNSLEKALLKCEESENLEIRLFLPSNC